jgi:hypothetical protein
MSQENINISNDGNNLLPVSDLLRSMLKPNAKPNMYSKKDIIESYLNQDKIQISPNKIATEEELREIFSNPNRNKTDKDNNPSKKQKN